MVRLTSTLLAAALTFATGADAIAAQRIQRPAVLMLRDPAGKPVEGALGLVLADSKRELPALSALGGLDLFEHHEPRVIGAAPSRRTGFLKCGSQDEAPRPGAVFVLADGAAGASLAAFVERLLPGDADKVELLATGQVVSAVADDEITLFAAALTGGRRIVLPALRGTSIPLPPGRYEAWVQRASNEFTWQQLQITSGATATVAFDGASRTLQRPADAIVTPAGRPDVILLDGDHGTCVLHGQAATAPLSALSQATGRLLTGTKITFPADEPTVDLRFEFGAPPAGTVHGFALSRTAFGDWRIHGAGRVDEAGNLRLPAISGGDDWLLVVPPALPPFAVPFVELNPDDKIEIPVGTPLAVRCTQDGGDPAPDVLLEYVPQHAEVATVAVRTDRKGNADFGAITLPGTIRASDPRYANVETALEAIPQDGVRLALTNGFEVRGTVQLPDGTAASGVTVTLRAPHDALRPRERSTVTDSDGGFAFSGLVEQHEYVVFATTRRQGRTWSSQVGRFAASSDALAVTIRDEDPQLGPGRGSGR